MTDEEKFQKTFDKLHASPDVFLISKRFLPWNIFHNKITEPALCISYQAPSLPETDLNNFPLRIQVFPRIPRYPLSYAMGTGTAFCID